jgi:UDP-glucose 4-epimerase
MRAVVTGGAGFIGSSLATALLARGDSVGIVDDFSTGRLENIAGIARDAEIFEGDIRDEALLARAFRGAEAVFHEAALPSVARSVEKPLESHEVNASGTLKVLLAARKAGVRRVVYASSSSAYGDTPTLPKVETMATAPLSPYAVSKLAGEQYCRVFPKLFGLGTVSLRYFNVFGPRQDPKSQYAAVVPLFITWVLAGRIVHIDGDGEQSRDFTFIENVVEANILAATAAGVDGEVFNIGAGKANTINELYRTICELTHAKAPAEHGPARPGDVRHSLADISKAGRLLGYTPRFDLRKGLDKTIEYFRSRTA